MLLTVATPAASQDVTMAEWEALLAETAAGGPAPAVSTVAGRSVDVSLLGDGAHRRARAVAALGGEAGRALDPDQLRRQAEGILSQPAYTGRHQSPWRRWLFDNPVTRWLRDQWNRFVRWIVERLSIGGEAREPAPGEPDRPSYGLPFLIAVAVGALLVAVGVIRRRRRAEREAVDWFHGIDEDLRSYAALEARAAEAESTGELTDAVRFRFLAGLLRLDELGIVEFRPFSTMRHLRRAVDSEHFDQAAEIFERAAYSPHPTTADDVARHRSAWDALLGVRP